MRDGFQLWLDHHDLPKVGRAVLGWYRKNRRDLPWRQEPDAYRVWVSEIMLQQTQIATVVAYYHRFLERFPDVRALASAGIDDVLSVWEGLGYYRRARSLHAAARIVVQEYGGRLPDDPDQLMKLPGIGRYTAGAILSIAGGQREPILEGNTIRLHTRLVACQDDIDDPKTRRQLWSFAESVLPKRSAGEFNQALMDIGSTICRPSGPDCAKCPLTEFCESLERGCQERIPFRKNRIAYEEIHETALVVNRRGKILVLKRGPEEWWSGLWDFPRVRLNNSGKRSANFPLPGDVRSVHDCLAKQFGLTGNIRPTGLRFQHAVTRYRITLDCLAVEKVSGRLRSGSNSRWQSPAEIRQLALTAPARRIASRLEGFAAGTQ